MNIEQKTKRLWEDNFYKGEVLLWEGRTQWGFQFGNSIARRSAFLQLIALLTVGSVGFILLAFLVPTFVRSAIAPWALTLWLIPGLAIALKYLVFCIRIPFNDFYAVTNKRALVAQNLIALPAVIPHLLENVTIKHNGTATGDIAIVSKDGLTRAADALTKNGSVFLNVAEPKVIAELMQRVANGDPDISPITGTRHITPIRD